MYKTLSETKSLCTVTYSDRPSNVNSIHAQLQDVSYMHLYTCLYMGVYMPVCVCAGVSEFYS